MTMATGTQRKKMAGTTLHVPIDGELREKLDQMKATDRRQRNDFVRILIEDEWNRREIREKGNGGQ